MWAHIRVKQGNESNETFGSSNGSFEKDLAFSLHKLKLLGNTFDEDLEAINEEEINYYISVHQHAVLTMVSLL